MKEMNSIELGQINGGAGVPPPIIRPIVIRPQPPIPRPAAPPPNPISKL